MTESIQSTPKNPGFGKRHIICAIMCYWSISLNISRFNISVAVVGMTSANSSNPNFPIYNWDAKQKNIVSSSYSAGLVVGCLMAGELIRLAGASAVMYSSIIVQAGLSFSVPFCTAQGGWMALTAIRVLIGFALGMKDPLLFYISSKWFPPNERNLLVNLAYAGGSFGMALAFQVAGLLSEGPTGWPSIFYLTAIMLLLFVLLWKLFGAFSPEECRNISSEEKSYLESCLKSAEDQKGRKVPWNKIMTSPPVYAILAAELSQGIVFSILVTDVPLFMDTIHKIRVSTNGLLSSLPLYVSLVLISLVGKAADVLIARKILRTVYVRKIASTIGMSGGAISIALLAIVGHSLTATIVLLFAGYIASAFCFIGHLINPIDISAHYSQNIVGVGRAVESVASYGGPLIFSSLLSDSTSSSGWGRAFAITVAPCLLLNVVYVVFSQMELQLWDTVEENESSP